MLTETKGDCLMNHNYEKKPTNEKTLYQIHSKLETQSTVLHESMRLVE